MTKIYDEIQNLKEPVKKETLEQYIKREGHIYYAKPPSEELQKELQVLLDAKKVNIVSCLQNDIVNYNGIIFKWVGDNG